MTRTAAGAVLLASLMAAGCGYHIGGRADVIPKTVKTIAIPQFSNGTVRTRLATLLTADVTREFHSRTKYVVVSDPAHADAVLRGVVTNFAVLGGSTTDSVTGIATSSQVVLTLQLALTDQRTGKTLYQRSGYEFRERYEIASNGRNSDGTPAGGQNLQQYFDESSTAIQRVSRDAAQSVVTAILEAF